MVLVVLMIKICRKMRLGALIDSVTILERCLFLTHAAASSDSLDVIVDVSYDVVSSVAVLVTKLNFGADGIILRGVLGV